MVRKRGTSAGPCWLIVAIVAVAFLLRICGAFLTDRAPASDERQYLAIATEIHENHRFALHNQVTAHRPPLYPLFLATCRYISPGLLMPRALQAALSALSLLFVAYLTRRVAKDNLTVALVTILGALAPSWIVSSSKLLSEVLFGFLLLAGTTVLVRSLDGPSSRRCYGWAVFSGVLFGLATLCRSVVLLLPPFWLLFSFLSRRTRHFTPRLLVFCMAWGVTILPWTVRNAVQMGAFIPVNTMAGIVFWQGMHPTSEGYGFVPWEEISRVTGTNDEVERNRILLREAAKEYLENPGRALQYEIAKFLWFWNPWDGDRYAMGSSFNVHSGLVFLLSGLCVFLWLRRRADVSETSCDDSRAFNTIWILSTMLAYFVLMALVFYGSPRFRMPVEPILWIGAGWGLAALIRWPRRLREPVAVLGLGCLFALYLAGDVAKDVVRAIADATFGYGGLW